MLLQEIWHHQNVTIYTIFGGHILVRDVVYPFETVGREREARRIRQPSIVNGRAMRLECKVLARLSWVESADNLERFYFFPVVKLRKVTQITPYVSLTQRSFHDAHHVAIETNITGINENMRVKCTCGSKLQRNNRDGRTKGASIWALVGLMHCLQCRP